jgi:hypothetical protein
MDMQAITEALRAKVGQDSGLGAVLKFDCGADGVAVIDGKNVPNSVSNAGLRGRLHGGHHARQPGRPGQRRAQPDERFHDGQVQGLGRHERRHEAVARGLSR